MKQAAKPDRTLQGYKDSYRRRYKRQLKDLLTMLQGELEGIEDADFVPSTGIPTMLLSLIQDGQSLKALTLVEPDPPTKD